MHQIFKFLLICALLFCVQTSAQVVEVTMSGSGSGPTKEHAVGAALSSAAAQAFGVQIEALTVAKATTVEKSNETSSSTDMMSQLNQIVTQKVNAAGNNPILGFKIDSADQSGAGVWQAAVTIRYAQFKKMGADSNRRSVVVVANDKKYRQLIITTVGDSLVGSRRFDVLNRENAALFDQEKAFIQGEDAAAAEVARLGQATGADYMVIAEVQGLSLANNQRETIQMTGEVLVRSSVSGMLKLQVIEFASRKVKWSSTEKFAGAYGGVSNISDQQMIALISAASDKLIEKLIANIYPIRVAKVVNTTTAVVNRGEDSIKKGEVFSIFQMGEELKDPQSGESLGAMEIDVGLGKIIDVKPKFSFFKLDSGTLEPNGEYILRKAEAPAAKPAAKPAAGPSQAPAQNVRKNTYLE